MIPFIDLQAQQKRIRPEIEAALMRVLDHGRYIMGEEISELEVKLAEFAGTRHCIACSNGTDALLLGLMAMKVGPGDAVFTTPFTFFATVEVISMLGATPIFVDVDPGTFNMDPNKLAEKIAEVKEQGTLRMRGIIPVDLFGLPCDYDAIQKMACANELFILEDGAQGFGAEYKGQRCPSFGLIGTTSFFPAKPLGGYGDGGAVFVNDDEIYQTLLSMRVHGQGQDKYDNIHIGLNARMSTFQAGILLEKLKIYPEEIDLRQQVAKRYAEGLKGSAFTPQTIPETCRSVWAQYCVLSDNRDAAQAALKEAGIPTAVYYGQPMHLLEAMKPYGGQPGDCPVAESLSQRIFALPMHPYLEAEQQGLIIETMRTFL